MAATSSLRHASFKQLEVSVSYCCRVFVRRINIKYQNRETKLTHEIQKETTIDKDVAKDLESDLEFKDFITYKKHAGIMKHRKTPLPAALVKAIKIVLEPYPTTAISEKSSELFTFIRHREPQAPGQELNTMAQEIEEKLIAKNLKKWEDISVNEEKIALLKKEVIKELRKNVNHWKPLIFDELLSLVYLYGRMSFDFSVILQCLNEIKQRDPTFSPNSIYHNGSKVGAGVWASNLLWNRIGEHYCVDFSQDMNNLAELLLKGGNAQERKTHISGVYFRRFEPSSKENKFPLVISPYQLIEIPTAKERRDHALLLWEMTTEYLVLIETGNKAGFGLLNQARETILDAASQSKLGGVLEGHTFAPCPHDQVCPRTLVRAHKFRACVTDCHHAYVDHNIVTKSGDTAKIIEKIQRKPLRFARFSYIILKKGPRKSDTGWPRVIGAMHRSQHSFIEACLPCGQSQRKVITKQNNRHLYKCARYTGLGDRLPVTLSCLATTEVNQDENEYIDQDQDDHEDTEII